MFSAWRLSHNTWLSVIWTARCSWAWPHRLQSLRGLWELISHLSIYSAKMNHKPREGVIGKCTQEPICVRFSWIGCKWTELCFSVLQSGEKVTICSRRREPAGGVDCFRHTHTHTEREQQQASHTHSSEHPPGPNHSGIVNTLKCGGHHYLTVPRWIKNSLFK